MAAADNPDLDIAELTGLLREIGELADDHATATVALGISRNNLRNSEDVERDLRSQLLAKRDELLERAPLFATGIQAIPPVEVEVGEAE